MNHIQRVHIVKPSSNLVHDPRLLLPVSDSRSDNRVHVSFAQLEHQVDIFVVFTDVACVQLDQIWMPVRQRLRLAHLKHDHYLSECPDCVDHVAERIIDLFDSDTLTIGLVDRFPHGPVVAPPHFLDHFVLGLDFLVHFVPVLRFSLLPLTFFLIYDFGRFAFILHALVHIDQGINLFPFYSFLTFFSLLLLFSFFFGPDFLFLF